MSARRSFTASEVNELIPRLGHSLRRLAELRQEIGARSNELERLGFGPLASGPEPPEVTERKRRLQAAVAEADAEVDRIGETGAILADLDRGLLEFPAQHEGREIYLSWQVDDREVAYFRWPDGLARQPL
jgi:hypothetical protein